MGKRFWEVVNEVLRESDIVLEVLDARLIEETRNIEIEEKVQKANKILIYVINKCDLVSQAKLDKIKLHPSVYVSSHKKYGITKLLHLILRYAHEERNIVGVMGYPNTGKSSVINALKGRASAPTSSRSGYTKGKQLIKITPKVYLLDTPGVLPYKEQNQMKHALIASLDASKVKDPEAVVFEIMENFKGKIEAYYKVKPTGSYEKRLEEIAIKNNKLLKGGTPDINTMTRMILQAWQKGKIKL
jgi:hypothetical protein